MKMRRLSLVGGLLALMVAVLAASGVTQAGPSATFAPKVSLELSTTHAASHPDARITVDNTDSTENVRAMTMSLPNGLWGSLAAAAKCPYLDAQADNCDSSSQIGTVAATATIPKVAGESSPADESNGLLRGKVYMTEPAPGNVANDPAGVTVIVHARVGNVDLGNVIVNARVEVRNKPNSPGAPTGIVGAVQGVDTIVDEVPQEITDTAPGHGNRKVAFHLDKMTIDLISDLDGPRKPLLTNPTSCTAPLTLAASFTGWESSSASASDPNPIAITGCSTLGFGPSMSATLNNPVAGELTGLTTVMEFPDGHANLSVAQVNLPPFAAASTPAFGQLADQCPVAGTSYPDNSFNPATCPAQAKIGTASLETPLIDGPVAGDVYLLEKAPIPNIGINVDPSVSSGNPKGVTIRLLGKTATVYIDTTCDPLFDGVCAIQFQATFTSIPDAPVSKMTLVMDGPDRIGVGGVTLSGKIFRVASAGDSACVPNEEFTATLISQVPGLSNGAIATQAIAGCNPQNVTIPNDLGSPVGGTTTSQTPSIPFNGVDGPFNCYFDSKGSFESNVEYGCTSPASPMASLTRGRTHRFFVYNSNNVLATRAFMVAKTPSPPNTPPVVTLTTTPTSVDVTDPSFSFTSDEAATFQCAINPGVAATTAFLPCSSAGQTAGNYGSANLIPGMQYTFAVRAEDAAGGVSAPKSTTFTVDTAFEPKVTTTLSDYRARAHPDLDIRIDNPSAENIKDLTFSMPDGFFGGLTGVASLCPLAIADAGGCTDASKVGTIAAEAVVDESVVRTTGTMYLTDSRDPWTQPASLSILIEPGVQDITFDPIIVNAELKIRGVAQGIDTFALNLPQKAHNDIDGDVSFVLRQMTMKLRTGAGATYPLLTNPSYCGAQAFNASFAGYATHSWSSSDPLPLVGCDALPFNPNLAVTLTNQAGQPPAQSDETRRIGVDLNANLQSNPDGAGIRSVSLTLPPTVTIDVQHLPFPCLEEQRQMNACPASTAIGTASATTPLLPTPLTGTVYVLKAAEGTGDVLPRVLVALRGAINTDIIGSNRFANVATHAQILSRFDILPDAPLSSFSMSIGKSFLTTRPNSCDFGPSDWNIEGVLNGYNGAQLPVKIPETFDCPQVDGPIATYKFKNRGKKSTFSAVVTGQTDKKIKRLKLRLPKRIAFIKSAFSKKRVGKHVTIDADGRKLRTTCFKRKNSKTLEVDLRKKHCRKSAKEITITLRKGVLNASRKAGKNPRFGIQVVDSGGKWRTVSILSPKLKKAKASYGFKNRGEKSRLSVHVPRKAGRKLESVTLKLPKKVQFVGPGLAAKKVKSRVTVRVGGKKLDARCFERSGTSMFKVAFTGSKCPEPTTHTVSLTFRSGTLKASRRTSKKPRFEVQLVAPGEQTRWVRLLG